MILHRIEARTPVRKLGGRWIVVYFLGGARLPEMVRGIRLRSLSEARSLARKKGGVVKRYHAKHWAKPEPRTWAPVATNWAVNWMANDLAIALEDVSLGVEP